MALIKCPECGKEISNKSVNCINCGYPLKKIDSEKNIEIEKFPDLPHNLGIGPQVVNWTDGAAIQVKFQGKDNFKNIENGDCNIYVHKYGIRISQMLYDVKIHRSQIVEIFTFNDDYLTDNKVVSKAIIGGILFGGIGAVVGGLSGVQKQTNGKFIGITYWDTELKQKVTVSFLAKEPVNIFMNRIKNDLLNAPASFFEDSPTEAEEKAKLEKQGMGCFVGIGIAIIVFVVLILLIK